jgi:hypothetical protein
LTLAEVDGLPLGSSQIGPATPGSTAETPTGTALAARLGFCLAVTESPIVVSSIQLLIYAGDIVSYRTLPNSSYAGQVLFPLSSDEGQGLYIFRLSDAAVDAAGSFLTADSGISVAITLQKPAPAPPFVALPSGSIRVFDQRPKDVFTDRS